MVADSALFSHFLGGGSFVLCKVKVFRIVSFCRLKKHTHTHTQEEVQISVSFFLNPLNPFFLLYPQTLKKFDDID